ncbi:MAG: tetratricopeptide repeat protein, partial [Bacteroidota bacterium]|nr:tetratricopeptide repeat protein [Bacteroidota bacterium]
LNRVYFAIGQIHLFNNDYESAKIFLKKCLSNNPSFEMEFNARIFYARTLINDNESDIDKYYLKLIKDKKNIEKLDRIFFEIGLMYESKKNFLDAIENFSTSVDNNNNNNNLLFYAYNKTADIYYDQINNYQLAKLYYDSALTNINREFKGYNKLKEKSDILTDLVSNLDIIETNDSLIYLTSLPEDVLNNILDKSIKIASQNKKKENSRALKQNFLPSESKVILGNKSEGDWYFDNESLLSIGKNDFQRIWGNRELKDNWRLISKISFNSNLDIDESRTVNEENIKNKSEDTDDENTVAKLKSSLPFDQSQKDILNKETEKAYYEVGKIYIQKLNEKEKGIENYNRFIERFSKSEYLAEIYYQLYLISNEAEKYKNLILSNYSDTDYYKLIINPNYQVDEFQELNLLKKIYNNLYENLRVGNNKKVIRSVDSLSLKYIDNSFFENIQLLKSIATGKEAGNFSLQYQLKKFLKYSLEEPPVNYAKTLLNSAKEVHEKFIFSGLPVFTKNNDSVFYFFIYMDPQFKENLVNRIKEILRKVDLPEDIFEFKLKNDVTFNVISLNNREKLKFIESEFNTSLTSEESNGNTNFVVGEKNMNLIFKSKNFTEFLKFIN